MFTFVGITACFTVPTFLLSRRSHLWEYGTYADVDEGCFCHVIHGKGVRFDTTGFSAFCGFVSTLDELRFHTAVGAETGVVCGAYYSWSAAMRQISLGPEYTEQHM